VIPFHIRFVLIFFLVLNLNANDTLDDEFEDDGFGDEETITIAKTQDSNNFIFYGSISSSINYSTAKKHTISSAKLSTNIKMEYKFQDNSKLKSIIKAYKDDKTDIEDDDYFDINEFTYERTFIKQIDAKFGRQIVVWGKSDNIRITDILNPLDNTTPGMTDIEDLRLGRGMSKFDYYNGDWAYSALAIYENRYSLMPKINSDYYNANISHSISDEPKNNTKNTAIALSASGNFAGSDIGFYFVNDFVDLKSYRTNMYGIAYNKVINNFLLKTEVAYFDNYDNKNLDDKTDSLVGVEYNGIDEGSISFEVANKDNSIQYATRFNQSYINQTLNFTLLYMGFEKDLSGGGFTRAWFDYDIDDKFSTTLGMINYTGGSKFSMESIKQNDRIFASLKYNF